MTLERDQICLAGSQGSIDLPINSFDMKFPFDQKKKNFLDILDIFGI